MKKNSKKILFIIGLVLLSLILISVLTIFFQKPPKYPFAKTDLGTYFDEYLPDYSISKKGLIEDVDVMVDYTNRLHADPYRMISKNDFLQKAEEIKFKINSNKSDKISAIDAFYYLQELAAYIKDGHTSLFPLNWEKTVKNIFPLTLESIDERIFVRKNYGKNSVPNRAEILSINGISIEQMRKDVMKYVPATLPHYKEASFTERIGLWIQTYYKMQSPWKVTYKNNENIETADVEGIIKKPFEDSKKKMIDGVITDVGKSPEDFPLTGPYIELVRDYVESEIKLDGKKVPVLDFLAFGNGEWEDFKAYIDNFFTKNKDTGYLIIDLRHNPGGDGSWGYYVLSYLTNNLKGYKEFSIKVNPDQKKIIQYFFQKAYYDMKIPKFLWGLPLYKLAKQDEPDYYDGRDIFEAKLNTTCYSKWEYEKAFLVNKQIERFKGKVFLLTSHETFSAGAGFAALFKSNDLGTIVGQETGGRVYMESDQRPVMLPNSNLLYLIPTFKYVVSDDNPDRGVMPDVTVKTTAEDYINNRDKEMEKVIELIKTDLR